MEKVSLKGVIDMHVHSAPDIRERAYTDFELMEAAIRVEIGRASCRERV